MTTSTHLIRTRRFLPLFVTQLLGAFNDNLFKNAMVLFVVYSVYNSEEAEAQFSATASAVFITVDAAHFAAHGDISGFGELFAELARYGGAGPDAGSR